MTPDIESLVRELEAATQVKSGFNNNGTLTIRAVIDLSKSTEILSRAFSEQRDALYIKVAEFIRELEQQPIFKGDYQEICFIFDMMVEKHFGRIDIDKILKPKEATNEQH